MKEWYSNIFKEKSKYERKLSKVLITTRDIKINDKIYVKGSRVDIKLEKKEIKDLGIIEVLSQI
jgi:hypothetical protein